MIYDRQRRCYGDGEWHCPFPPEWVERMAHAAQHCALMPAEQIEATLRNQHLFYKVPPGEYLSEEQDARGLPLSWCAEEATRYAKFPTCCKAIYDYASIPDVVITNGHDDWPLKIWYKRQLL